MLPNVYFLNELRFYHLFRQMLQLFEYCNCLLATLNRKYFGMIFFSLHVNKNADKVSLSYT